MTSQPQHRLLGFGSNYFHALGGSNEISMDVVQGREYLEGYDVQQLCCTTTSSLILTHSGKIYQVGMIHGLLRDKPERIFLSQKVLEIAGGRHFCLARCNNGSVVSWGAGHFGQLGHGPNVSLLERPEVLSHLLPDVIGGSPIIQIACGAWHGTALTQDGTLYCWGSNRRHQCGVKAPSTVVYPQAVEGNYSEIACGKGHNVALEQDTGRVYTWGSSVGCGHSSRRTTVPTPRLLEALQRVVIVSVAAGDSHSLALTGGGRVFSWGLGPEGQLGMGGSFAIIPRPKLVGDLDFVAIVAGQQLAETSSTLGASIRHFAHNRMNSDTSVSVTSIPSTPNLTAKEQHSSAVSQILANVPKVNSIHAAGSYSLAVSSSGHVYAWGYNDCGVLGLPHPTNLPTVEPVSASASIAQIKSRTPAAKTFDSQHNVLIPQRVDALSDLDVTLVAGGPSHLLVYGKVRDPNDAPNIGRTLHEVQQARRSMLPSARSESDDISLHSAETDAVTMATDAMSQTTDPTIFTPDSKAVFTPDSKTKPPEAAMLPITPIQSPTTTTPCSPASAPAVSQPISRTVKPRSMSMSKIMQKFTNGSDKKKNGESRPKMGRVLAAFGNSGK
jgi:alpha-tubulin suppressor-like RCC1 family protein